MMVALVVLVLAYQVPEACECDAPLLTHLQALGRAYGLALPRAGTCPTPAPSMALEGPFASVLAGAAGHGDVCSAGASAEGGRPLGACPRPVG